MPEPNTKVLRVTTTLYELVYGFREKLFERLIDLGREGYKVRLESIGIMGFFGYLLGLGLNYVNSKTDTDEKLIDFMSKFGK